MGAPLDTTPPRAQPLGLLVLGSVLLGLVLPVALMSFATTPFIAAWAVQLVCAMVSGTALAAVLTTVRLRPMQLAFWTFAYVWLGIAPMAMLTRDVYPWGLRAEPEVSFDASLLVLVGMAAYLVGMFCARAGSAGPGTGALAALGRRELSPRRVVVLGIVSLLLAAVLIPRLGGPTAFLTSRQASNAATAAVTGSSGGAGAALLNWGLSVPAFWALLALLLIRRTPLDPRRRWALRALLVAVVAVNVVVNNPISQPRYWAGTVLLGLLFSTRWLESVRVFRIAAVAMLAAVVVLFPLADYFRYDNRTVEAKGVVEQLVSNPDYDAYQQVQGGVQLVAAGGHQPELALSVPLFWVPRAVWPDKPVDAGVLIAEDVGYTFTNLSSPLWIETYMWGGLPVTALCLGLLGWASARADRGFDRERPRSLRLTAVMVPPLAFYQLIILRGSLLQAMAALSLLVVVPLLVSRRPPDVPTPARTPRLAGATSQSSSYQLEPMSKGVLRS